MEFAEVTYVERVDHAALLRRSFKLRVIVAFIHAFINDRSYIYATRAQTLNESVGHCVFIDVQANLRCGRVNTHNFDIFFQDYSS